MHKDYSGISAVGDIEEPYAIFNGATDGPNGAIYFSLNSEDKTTIINNLSLVLADFENFIKAVLDIKEWYLTGEIKFLLSLPIFF